MTAYPLAPAVCVALLLAVAGQSAEARWRPPSEAGGGAALHKRSNAELVHSLLSYDDSLARLGKRGGNAEYINGFLSSPMDDISAIGRKRRAAMGAARR